MKYSISPQLVAALLATSLVGGLARAADEPATKMTQRGKLIFSDDLSQPLTNAWKTGKGKWEVVAGTIRGSELVADKHGAVTRRAMPTRNAVIQYSFKLEGAKATSLSVNSAKEHVCRVVFSPSNMIARKDDKDHAGPNEAVTLETVSAPIANGEWHTLVVELLGPEMLATLDGKYTAYGSHPEIDVDKANIGLTVGGESVSFKDLKVWEATPNTAWPAEKAKLKAAASARAEK